MVESSIILRKYEVGDVPGMLHIWNSIVEEGNAFPQISPLDLESGIKFFAGQSYCGIAQMAGSMVGLYILHPNNIGRCGHIANASYGVDAGARGKGIGASLVLDSLAKARELGFGILQFNAVVATNLSAIHLYEKLGFHALGTVPHGFRHKDGSLKDIRLYYYQL